jgi:hypothetical protein
VSVVVFVGLAIVLGVRRAHRAMQLPVPTHIGLVMSVAVALASHGRRVASRAIGVRRVLRTRALVTVGV